MDMTKTKKGNRGFKVGYRSFCLRKGGLTATKNRTDCKFSGAINDCKNVKFLLLKRLQRGVAQPG